MEKAKSSCFPWVIACSFIIILCFLVSKGSSIVCYQCNSEYDPRCGDPFDPYSLGTVNCSIQPPLEHLPELTPTICRKNVQRVYGKIRVVRGCGFIEDENKERACIQRTGTHDVFMNYCTCKGDLCNSAVSLTSSTLVILITAAILL
ncbi:UPAR/Ly6 domain-containing protein crok-like [Lycorma delicatula]|uniref:UPAR/Ly6 domain-containing protein crok-like n=1 Tax=Lycorma delicatula TaxID=130591 RepID=UPI003F518C52